MGYKQRVTKGEIGASKAKSRWLFNTVEQVCFSALKRLPRERCVSLVGRALAVNLIKDVAAQTRHASITPTV